MFIFIKQKTAYEMRISDWSSDGCSSDLGVCLGHVGHIVSSFLLVFGRGNGAYASTAPDVIRRLLLDLRSRPSPSANSTSAQRRRRPGSGARRSDERRVGKE